MEIKQLVLTLTIHLPCKQLGKLFQKVTREVGKIEIAFKSLRQEICSSLTNFEQKFDLKLATISQKIDAVEST